MTEPGPRKTRILIGAGTFADASTALRLAAHLLDGTASSLGGLLVQQEDVLALCRLPNRQVVTSSGTLALAPSLSQIKRLMQADARAFRELLAEIAGPPRAEVSFEQQRGDLVDASVQVGKAWDVLIFGYRRVHPVPGQVVVLTPTRPDGDTAPRLAQHLAKHLHTGLVALTVGPPSGGEGHVGPHATLRVATLAEALGRLTRLNAQAVVVDLAHGPIHTHDELRHLLESARCPVVVVGAASEIPALEHSTHFAPGPDPRTL